MQTHRNQKFRFSPEKEKARERDRHHSGSQVQSTHHLQLRETDSSDRRSSGHESSSGISSSGGGNERAHGGIGGFGLSDSSRTIASQEEDKAASKEEREAKKTRVKQSLMKRARSVAIFSLKLKERRAKEAEVKAKEAEREARWQQPQSCVGGELSCIPIEKLISVDDIAAMEGRRLNH